MIVILKRDHNPDQLEGLVSWLQEKGITIHTSIGEANTILGLVGDTSKLDIDLIAALDIVEDVKRVQEPYKNANRKFHPEDSQIAACEEKAPDRVPSGAQLSVDNLLVYLYPQRLSLHKALQLLFDFPASLPDQLSHQAVGAGIGPVGRDFFFIQKIQDRPWVINI